MIVDIVPIEGDDLEALRLQYEETARQKRQLEP